MRDLIARVGPSLAEVVVQTRTGWLGAGTAFAISANGVFATCAHVIAGAPRLALNFDGRYHDAAVLQSQDAIDVALLKIESESPALALAAVNEVHVGDQLLWSGFPLDSLLPTWHQGMASYIGPLPVNPQPLGVQLDGTVNRGNSGGPIINPDTSAVVGMVTSKMGGLSQHLQESFAKLAIVSGMGGGMAARMTMTVGGVTVDPNRVLMEAIHQIERGLQLGVGYGISAEYVANLKASVAS